MSCGPPTAARRVAAPATGWPCTTARSCAGSRSGPPSGCPATSMPPTWCSPGCSGCSRPSTGSTPAAAPASRATRFHAAVLDELRAQDWVPRAVRLRAREAERVGEQLAMRLRRTATGREIADALGVPLHELGAAAATRVLSVEQLRTGADGSVFDTLAGTEPDPAGAVQEHETRRQLWQAIEQLGERDRLVVRLYYLEDRTLAEIGRTLGVTESRVCQLHGRLVARLRACLVEAAR